jgi:tetratricopeptide (TPR) repeat protein
MEKSNRFNFNTVLLILILLVSLAGAAKVFFGTYGNEDRQSKRLATAKRLAGELADNNLHEAAIAEYAKVLEDENLDDAQRGALNYLIAKIYFNDIGDYRKAAAYYLKAKSLDEDAPYAVEAGKNLIASLERMGRRLQARRELDRETSLEADSEETSSGKPVAKIGSYTITTSDFEDAIDALPQNIREKMTTPDAKRKFLDQLVGRELLFRAAVREGLDNNPEFKKQLHEVEKDFLVQLYSQKNIAPNISPDTSDLQMFYKANKEDYGDKPLEDVRDQVVTDYMAYISQKAVRDYVSKLEEAEPVQIFEENLK